MGGADHRINRTGARIVGRVKPDPGIIACTIADVLGYGCICEKNGWEHEWGPAFPPVATRPGLHWCANCDCCVADMEPISEWPPLFKSDPGAFETVTQAARGSTPQDHVEGGR